VEAVGKGHVPAQVQARVDALQGRKKMGLIATYNQYQDDREKKKYFSDWSNYCLSYVFNVLCRNTDDHPRNHGFLWGEKSLVLSPAYDIVPSLARAGIGTDFCLSMSLGEGGREATLKNAMSMSARFGSFQDEAYPIIEEMKIRTGCFSSFGGLRWSRPSTVHVPSVAAVTTTDGSS
jgi:hypothetical protein